MGTLLIGNSRFLLFGLFCVFDLGILFESL
jgi:hypothetical protein